MDKSASEMQRISISLTAEDYALLMAKLFAEQTRLGKPIPVSEFVRDTLRKHFNEPEQE